MLTIPRLLKQKTGLSIRQFCEQKIKADYKAFHVRLSLGKLYPSEIIIILDTLKLPCELVFRKSFEELILFSDERCTCIKQAKEIMKRRKDDTLERLGIKFLKERKPIDPSLLVVLRKG